MISSITNNSAEKDTFFREYTSRDAILKYTKATAGFGISYLLDHDYKAIYLDALRHLSVPAGPNGFRMLEFGCGGGMNLLHLMSVLGRHGFKIDSAIGTDFSPVLIEAANKETESYLAPPERDRVRFCVAKNETLLEELSTALKQEPSKLENSFQFIIGVNTIRYCHRSGKQLDCARDIFRLLAPGGVCVVIDMYADKLSMAHSLEVRVPYLDRTVVEYVQRLSANFKVRNGTRKWLHRQVCQSYLPRQILKRKKRGFAVNVVDDWFRSSLGSQIPEMLLDEQALVFDLLEPQPVAELLKAHRTGRQDNHKILFSLVMLEQWLRGLGSKTREKDTPSLNLTAAATV